MGPRGGRARRRGRRHVVDAVVRDARPGRRWIRRRGRAADAGAGSRCHPDGAGLRAAGPPRGCVAGAPPVARECARRAADRAGRSGRAPRRPTCGSSVRGQHAHRSGSLRRRCGRGVQRGAPGARHSAAGLDGRARRSPGAVSRPALGNAREAPVRPLLDRAPGRRRAVPPGGVGEPVALRPLVTRRSRPSRARPRSPSGFAAPPASPTSSSRSSTSALSRPRPSLPTGSDTVASS